MTRISRAMGALGLLLGSGVCAMADTVWTFSDVFFDNGNEVTGSFSTNPTTTAVDSFAIQVTGSEANDAFTPTQLANLYLPSVIGIANADFSEYVDLYLASPMTSAGGTIDITSGYDCPDCGSLVVSSDVTPTVSGVPSGPAGVVSTPEPSSAPFVGAGVVLMGVLTRRRSIRATRM